MAAEVRGSELHVAENWEKTDGVSTLCRVLLGDGVYACAVWATIQRLVRFNMHQDGVTASQRLTDSLKARFIPSKGEANSYHEVTLTTFHLKNSCMIKDFRDCFCIAFHSCSYQKQTFKAHRWEYHALKLSAATGERALCKIKRI